MGLIAIQWNHRAFAQRCINIEAWRALRWPGGSGGHSLRTFNLEMMSLLPFRLRDVEPFAVASCLPSLLEEKGWQVLTIRYFTLAVGGGLAGARRVGEKWV